LLALTGGLVVGAAPSHAAGGHHRSAERPGQIVSAEPVVDYVAPGVKFQADAWHVTYRSTSATGHLIVDSGTVLVPTKRPAGPRRLVGFAVGSQGLADKCAASAALASGTEYESSNINAMLERGWAVAVPDYPGLGTPGQHTYAIGRALGPSVLDAMRAARNLTAADLPKHGPAAIMGYSEGGGAAGWAVQLQPTYAPDVPLVGGAVGGVITDLPKLAAHLDGSAFSFLVPYTAIGMQAAYPSLHLRNYLTANGKAVVRKLEGSCLEDASLDYLPFTKSRSITTRDLFTLPKLKRIMAINQLGRKQPSTSILLQQSKGDEILSYSQAVELDQRWCSRGARVDFKTIPTPEHILSGLASDPGAIEWLAQRFSRARFADNCPSSTRSAR
jgi:hypothetical protein